MSKDGMPVMYGISNCDTIRKARRWLDDAGVDFRFHDYRKDGIDAQMLAGWCQALGWEALLNRHGTTWRRLDDAAKADLDEERAIALMCEHPAMIKRPLLDVAGHLELGFSAERYDALFA